MKGLTSLIRLTRQARTFSAPPTMSAPRWKPQRAKDLNLPEWVTPSPFEWHWSGPLTRSELIMCKLSWALRSKPDWQRKAADPTIRAKWRQEAADAMGEYMFESEDHVVKGPLLTEAMIDYVLDELEGHKKISDNERGVERACFEGVWYSDRILSEESREQLKIAVRVLEDIPEEEKDWHPGSNNQVLDLVHPSLYPIVYGRTHAYLPNQPRENQNFLPVWAESASQFDRKWASQKFCWMPSDLSVDADSGAVKLVSPYINNMHLAIHKPLYPIVEEVITALVPLWERVLGDVIAPDRFTVLERFSWVNSGRIQNVGCIWESYGEPSPDDEDCPEDMSYEEFADQYRAALDKNFPEANTYKGQLEEHVRPVSLRGRQIQCIVKLANIHLTPEKPEYEGGNWHVEGMMNERIVASGIYYYDQENITESKLSFRVATEEPGYHGQDDDYCMDVLYGIGRNDACVQEVGSVISKAGRLLAWPNIFQHCVSPFRLADPTKPGHRKILAVFLVDPTKEPLPSATLIPPQQLRPAGETMEEVYDSALSAAGDTSEDSNPAGKGRLPFIPRELRDLVKSHITESVMTLEEAKAYRLQLMEERTVFVVDHTEQMYQAEFNMCELDDEGSLSAALEGVDIVLSALGPRQFDHPSGTPLAHAYEGLIKLMKQHGINRLLALGTVSVEDKADRFSVVFSTIVAGANVTMHNAYKDIRALADVIRNSSLEHYTIFRVPILSNNPSREVVAGYIGDGKLKNHVTLNRAGFAAFVVAEIEKKEWDLKAPVLVSA
ncbi:hypothetical protein HMN09_00180200 [Mycena chlorophos]|uniref:NAD(P)-binding domain-containing protein n=1 Tax=Mycena chlorophos TaxID=658473 RepID=A0A8H6TSH3_MYCCL|nr:hypothetical protein HMN09_00180200 [Mycena chlorophos]